MYRYNLRQEKWIQLRDEIEYTKRYPRSCSIKWRILRLFDIEEEVLEEKVIKAILQPLVENSTRHGLRTGLRVLYCDSGKTKRRKTCT